jgi:hypothetical protein
MGIFDQFLSANSAREAQREQEGRQGGSTTDIGGALRSIYRAAVPTNARILLETMAGKTSDITEDDLEPDDLEALKSVVAQRKDHNLRYEEDLRKIAAGDESAFIPNQFYHRHGSDPEYMKQAAKESLETRDRTRNNTSVGYESYGDAGRLLDNKGLGESIKKSYTEPRFRMATTLGAFNATDDDKGTLVRDVYRYYLDKKKEGQWKGDTPIHDRTISEIYEKSQGPVRFFEQLYQKYFPDRERKVNIRLPVD